VWSCDDEAYDILGQNECSVSRDSSERGSSQKVQEKTCHAMYG